MILNRIIQNLFIFSSLIFIIMHINTSLAAEDMPHISAENAGISTSLSSDLNRAFNQGKLDNLHAVLVLRHGKVAVENYYSGIDENWGTPLGRVDFNSETLHDLRSVTKSIVSLL